MLSCYKNIREYWRFVYQYSNVRSFNAQKKSYNSSKKPEKFVIDPGWSRYDETIGIKPK